MNQGDSPLSEDIVFIFDECKRIMDMGRDVFKLLPKDEAFFDLPHPSGHGRMLCGRAAAARVEKLATEAGRRSGLSRRVTHQTLRTPTAELLVQRFITEKRDLDQKQIDRFLASVGRRARAACADITHFVPCTLMTAQDPEVLTIGPVIFRNRASFRRRMLAHLNGYGGEQTDARQRDFVRKLMADAARFYRQFDWVAEVTVKGCDPKTSERIAERAVTAALDCLHLIFRAQSSSKMRVGGPALRTDRRAGVTIGTDGKMHPHGSTAWAGQVNFPDGWSRQLEDSGLAHILSLCGLALEAAVDPDLARPVSRRFLDAAQWFGEASRDDRAATRVVKYVTALERMVMTDEMDDIAKLVSERVAALCCDRTDASDRQTWRDDAQHVYDLRSRLVHGSMSPSAPEIEKGVWLAARIGEETLLGALGALGEAALKAEVVSTRRLAQWYGMVITTTDELEAARERRASP
jgi:hypothetical protein